MSHYVIKINANAREREQDNNAHKAVTLMDPMQTKLGMEKKKSKEEIKKNEEDIDHLRYWSRLAAGMSDPLQNFINLINKAKSEHKIFSVCGNFGPIRRALLERGWIEKPRQIPIADRDQLKLLEHIPNGELYESVLRGGEYGEKCRKVLIGKLLHKHQVRKI